MEQNRNGNKVDLQEIWAQYQRGIDYNTRIDLYDTVEVNENFFIGKQWEGVEAQGLPTPVFNFLKRVVLYLVSSAAADNLKLQATPMQAAVFPDGQGETIASVVNGAFESLLEHNKVGNLVREMLRAAAIDGDGCLYTYFDSDAETGQAQKGAIRTEIVENTRVLFGNPNDRRVETQPFIILVTRELTERLRQKAGGMGAKDAGDIVPDSDETTPQRERQDDDKTTVLLKFWRKPETGEIWALETTKTCLIKKPFPTGLFRYPIAWLSWDYIPNSYHGQAAITGLIPNQVFINKLFAMAMISLMTTAYPRVLYDKTRIASWDGRVGAAIGVHGGDMGDVARILDPAQISPQVSQFIELAVTYTQNFLGATDAALGNVRPDNTSAIIALQEASSIPLETVKRNLFQCLEDLGRIYLDFMGAYYGTRLVEQPDSMAGGMALLPFDFSVLQQIPLSLQLDVGASAYWSEIASIQTLDNLLAQDKLDLEDYLERLPDGYVPKKQALIEKIRAQREAKAAAQTAQMQETSTLGQIGGPFMEEYLRDVPGEAHV
jgi:hypothetical protein